MRIELTDAEARDVLDALRVARRQRLATGGAAGVLTGLIDTVEVARAWQERLARWLMGGSLVAILGIVVWRVVW